MSTQARSTEQLHLHLMDFGRIRLTPSRPEPEEDWEQELKHTLALTKREIQFIETAREDVVQLASQAPSEADAFIVWFEALREQGPGQGDPLFPWLADTADLAQMRWFIQQEVAGEAGFEDLVALTQLRMPATAKLEMARNYWDEMGRGSERGMHGPMLDDIARELNIDNTRSPMTWEALALGNLMVGFACNRRYAYHSVGALGAIELTAPTRATFVAAGLKRLKASKQGRLYFTLHASIDIRHANDWNREVITSLIRQDPSVARFIAEGALMRLQAGALCFDRYRAHFGLDNSPLV